jgi:outer membrane protein OmpA-like peptidoglycan-associated protein
MGTKGEIGERGSTTAGVAGLAGAPGISGARGTSGQSGTQGPVGVVANWSEYRDVVFLYDRSDIEASQKGKIAEVAEYMSKNPSLKVGIDSSIDPSGNDPRDRMLTDRRRDAVRDALMQAGVPAERIQTGVRGDPKLIRDRRIGLLVSTSH